MTHSALRRILVVDDSHDIADLLVDVFSSRGHDAHAVYSGADAIEVVARRPPDIVFLDISMPDMTGFEVAQRIRRLCAAPPKLVAFTSLEGPEFSARVRSAGLRRYMSKPAERTRALNSGPSSDVNATSLGGVAHSRRIRSATSKPVMSGMLMSRKTMSGGRRATTSIASAPL